MGIIRDYGLHNVGQCVQIWTFVFDISNNFVMQTKLIMKFLKICDGCTSCILHFKNRNNQIGGIPITIDKVDNYNKCVVGSTQHPKIKKNCSCKYKKQKWKGHFSFLVVSLETISFIGCCWNGNCT